MVCLNSLLVYDLQEQNNFYNKNMLIQFKNQEKAYKYGGGKKDLEYLKIYILMSVIDQ